MGHLLLRRGRDDAVLSSEGARRLAKLVVHAGQPRLEASALRVGEPFGELEAGQVAQGLLDRVESLDQAARLWSQRR